MGSCFSLLKRPHLLLPDQPACKQTPTSTLPISLCPPILAYKLIPYFPLLPCLVVLKVCLIHIFLQPLLTTTSSLDCWLSYPWFKSPISRLASLLTKMLCFFPTCSGESNIFLPILKKVPIINAVSVSSTPAVQPVVGSYLSYCNSTCMPNHLRGMRSLRRSLRCQHISCLFSL